MERKEKPKQTVRKNDGGKSRELKTEPPISEKDEVKQAEERIKNSPAKQ
jgi:hypothetical protein